MKYQILAVGLPAILVLAAGLVFAAEPQKTGAPARLEKATFAGGCFWCMEHPFDELEGVVSVTPGYTGGHKKNPTYEEVSSGTTGHAESVQIVYDPAKITYTKLLDVFWHNIDPTVQNQQFCDIGTQYRTAIFFHNEEQKRLAEESKRALEKSGRFKGSYLHGDCSRVRLLSCGGIPSALLQEESYSL